MTGLSLGASVPNLKFVSSTVLKLLAFNATNFTGSRDAGHAPFYPLLTFGVGGRQVTSFELWTAIIGSETTPEKCFNTPIENALCRCQFWGKLGKNRGCPYWILTPNERFLSHQVPDVCAKFHQNRLKIATVRARTDRQTNTQTHRQRWQGWSYNLSHAMLQQWDR